VGIAFITLVFVGIIFWLMIVLYNASKAIRRNENSTEYSLEKVPEGCKVLNKTVLNIGDMVMNIEKILVSKQGVFVIMTKECEGWIFGKEEDKYWVQMAYNRKNKFRNPILENSKYVEAVRKRISDMKHVPVYSIILFKDECTLKRIDASIPVMNCWELRRYILGFKNDINLSDEEIEKVIMALKKNIYFSKN